MLTQDDLTTALKRGQGDADVCSRGCRVGAVVDACGYRIHHNGCGTSDTSAPVVYAESTLQLNVDGLAARIRRWIGGLHAGERVDLNAE